MTVKATINSVSDGLPYSRTKLLDEVILERQCGPIHEAWISTGHLHILLKDGHKLVTFDCKTADYIQETEDHGCLDLEVTVPILTILTQPHNSVLVVQVNGHTQQWRYRKDSTWKLLAEFDICNAVRSEVTDICLNITQNSLYWCEKRTSSTEKPTFCICKRHIIEDEGKERSVSLGSVAALIHNCPDSRLYPMAHGVLAVTDGQAPMVSVCLRLCTLTGKIQLVTPDATVTLTDVSTHNATEFREIILKCLSYISQLQAMPTVLGAIYMSSTQKYIQLLQDGHLSVITNDTESGSHKSSVCLDDFTSDGLLGVMTVQGHIGVCYPDHIRQHSVVNGQCVGRVRSPDDTAILGMCQPLLGTGQAAVYTPHDLFLIQKSHISEPAGDEVVLMSNLFQTDAVKLAFLDKSRFLTEYWKLENMLRAGLKDNQAIQKIKQLSVKDEVERLLDPKSAISRSGRQAQLLLLSQHAPGDVLAAMLSYLDLGKGELSTSQLQKWQCVLTQENTDVAGSCSIAVPLLEQICHLLYKWKPDQLMQFLRRGQQVCDQKVGVTAFIRKRQTLLVYERALRCIPDPEQSVDMDAAVFVHVQLLLVSEVEQSLQRAVRMLVRYRRWTEAIDLLRGNTDKSQQHVILFQIVLSALIKNQVLHQFAEQIFPLMPSLQCCVDLPRSGKDKASDVFCTGPSDISVDCVRAHLLQCLQKGKDTVVEHRK